MLNDCLAQLRDKIAELNNEADSIHKGLEAIRPEERVESHLTIPSILNNQKQVSYNINWVWIKKIRFVLEQSFREMSTADVVDALIELQPALKPERVKIVSNVSALLGQQTKSASPLFSRRKNDSGEWIYKLIGKPVLQATG